MPRLQPALGVGDDIDARTTGFTAHLPHRGGELGRTGLNAAPSVLSAEKDLRAMRAQRSRNASPRNVQPAALGHADAMRQNDRITRPAVLPDAHL